MTVERAQEIFEAMGECYKRKCSCEYQCYDCDSCDLMYAQGTMGEIREACYLVVGILEAIKHIDTDAIYGCYTRSIKKGSDHCDHCIYKMEADDDE